MSARLPGTTARGAAPVRGVCTIMRSTVIHVVRVTRLGGSQRRHGAGAPATRPSQAALRAGVLAAVAGLLAFLVIHHLWILPIWFILPVGLPIAMLGGLAVGWAYGEVLPALPPRPWRHLAWIGGVAVILAPSLVLAELRPAFFDASTGDLAPGTSIGRIATAFGVELLLPAAVIAAALGALTARTPRATLASAVAGFVFALGPGHNIPLLAGTPGAGRGAALLGAIVVVSTVVLIEAHARFSRR